MTVPPSSRPPPAEVAPLAPRWLSASALVAYTGISERTWRSWAALGRVHPSREGRCVRYDRLEVDALMQAAKGEGAEVLVCTVPSAPALRTVTGPKRGGARRAS